MPNQDLVGLINSLQATAEAALGDLNASSALARRDGLDQTPDRARQTAERSLRLLTMLAEKTRGNLDLTEAELLGGAIAQLRERLAN
ncbi:DUF1844 domain-containing protein [Deinococcus sonorensis]|uniref:DUF1844 domain-containing protein n=2 Tax=Deinococcus sonorensis TaxID=309891 RepID=A0AAU7UB85_9DEIO